MPCVGFATRSRGDWGWAVAALLLVVAAPRRAAAHPHDPQRPPLEVLPGSARAIDRKLTADPDSPWPAFEAAPYVELTAGADVGLIRIDLSSVALRMGFFGFLKLHSDRPLEAADTERAPFLPTPGLLWRGANGFSLAFEMPWLAERLFGDGGRLELTWSLRHESEHFTGSRSGNDGRFADVPNMGDFVMPDLAIRIERSWYSADARLFCKFFAPGAYGSGPGAEAAFRITHWEAVQPFASLYAEWLTGRDFSVEGRQFIAPDNRRLRSLLGVALPGYGGDILLYGAFGVGNGKGLLAFREEVRGGGGVRLAFF